MCLDVVQRYLFAFGACVHGVMLCASVHVCFDSSPMQTRTARGTQRRCLRKLSSSSSRIAYVSLFMHPSSHEGVLIRVSVRLCTVRAAAPVAAVPLAAAGPAAEPPEYTGIGAVRCPYGAHDPACSTGKGINPRADICPYCKRPIQDLLMTSRWDGVVLKSLTEQVSSDASYSCQSTLAGCNGPSHVGWESCRAA